jgi:hypothetical protein
MPADSTPKDAALPAIALVVAPAVLFAGSQRAPAAEAVTVSAGCAL